MPTMPSTPARPTAPPRKTGRAAARQQPGRPSAGGAAAGDAAPSPAHRGSRAATTLPARDGGYPRGELFAAECPSRNVFRHVTSLWGVLALIALQDGTQRFSALRRRVRGVSEKMLAQTLQLLEQDGLVHRLAHPVVPPHVDYSLTPLGQQVATRVAALADCIETNLGQVMQHQQAHQPHPLLARMPPQVPSQMPPQVPPQPPAPGRNAQRARGA